MSYYLNTKNIIESPRSPAVVKLTAMELDKMGYFSMAHILDKISDHDLHMLQMCAESKNIEDQEVFAVFSMLCLVAEGGQDIEDSTIASNMHKCVIMVNLEGLRRKGMITFDPTQLSFLDFDKIQAVPTELGIEMTNKLRESGEFGPAGSA
jgi:hypothetical protein